ncbi:ArsR/SmtB family transcription factor [Bdellovibrio sp. HCB117]|nr:helix-turn-helix domain-containing protein [Bdellovibrio bacteriovorus]
MLDIYLTMETIDHPKLKDISLEQVLKALGDPVRLSVVKQLLKDPEGEIACGSFDYSVTKATFSHHMQILREAGVTRSRQDGTKKLVSLRLDELEKRFPGLIEVILTTR